MREAERPMTRRQILAGKERLKDPSASEGKVLRRAGYAHGTCRSPAQHNLDSTRFAERVVAESGHITSRSARAVGLKTLVGLAEDADGHAGARAVAAKALVDFSVATEGDDPVDPIEAVRSVSAMIRELTESALLCGLRRPDQASRILSRRGYCLCPPRPSDDGTVLATETPSKPVPAGYDPVCSNCGGTQPANGGSTSIVPVAAPAPSVPTVIDVAESEV